MATLEIIAGKCAGQKFDLARSQIVIGRFEFCDVLLDQSTVSRQHAQILRGPDGFQIEDLGSLNGTYVNGRKIEERTRLADQDQIRIYDSVMVFRAGDAAVKKEPSAAPTIAVAPKRQAENAPLLVQEDRGDATTATVVSALDARAAAYADTDPQAKLRAVLGIARNLGSTLDAEEILPKILASLFEIFPQADRGYILLIDEESGELSTRAIRNRDDESGGGLTLGPISRTIAERVLSRGQAILSADPGDDSALESRGRSMMCAPLTGGLPRALGIVHVDTTDGSRVFDEEDLEVLVSVATVAGQALELVRAHHATMQLDRKHREMAMARDVQLQFLPERPPEVPGHRFFDYYRAADEIGGDYYDYIPLPDGRLAIAVADVVGKGVSAALLMARLCTEVRYALVATETPAQALARLNRRLSGPGQHLVTLVVCVLDPARHELTVVNAGHPAPLLRRSGTRTAIAIGEETRGMPMGFDLQPTYDQCTVELNIGDAVVLYTDGVSEAMNRKGKLFGNARVRQIIGKGPQDVEELGTSLLREVKSFCGSPQFDDLCVVCFRRES
jgi:sigma-B regulation protein RsbU (phosphoserine phosphatase)